MDSPLDAIDSTFSSAVFTTYSLNARFFEHWVMPLLHRSGIRNVVIFVDETQLGAALDDRGLRSVGRTYQLVSTRLGPGAFHPKLIFLHGDENTRACVSSANLTVDGQLRNVEGAIVLDSSDPGHRRALADTAMFVRRLAAEAEAPPHVVDAVIAALPADLEQEELPPATVRVVHNLDEPLLTVFPESDLTATAPFADSGAAATALATRGQLTVITDGDAFAATGAFFAGSWSVQARRFKPRRLHAKAYAGEDWLLIGSPNLSTPALLQTASAGNTELAVVLTSHPAEFFASLPGEAWAGERPINEVAALRHREERLAEAEHERVGSFNAWEDDGQIAVSGISDVPLEHWNPQTGVWEPLGQVTHGRVTPPPDTRPHLIRCTQPNGRIDQAIVHRPRLLRSQREQPRTISRGAQAVSKLPLELQGVKALEDALHDLYALESLQHEAAPPRHAERAATRSRDEPDSLSEWRPAREDDEPRIPDLYRRAWQGEPDTLLALIRKALRLDDPDAQPGEDDLLLDEKPLHDAEEDQGERPEDDTVTPEPPPEPIRTTASVVARYRGALVKLLERGVAFVRDAESAALADLALVAILRLHEELAQTEVTVDDEPQALVDQSLLIEQKIRLLDAYLHDREGHDPSCVATARAHIGLCLKAREQMSPLSWETLERIAHERAADLLADNPYAERAARDAAVQLGELDLLIRPYAERADWTGYVVFAAEELEDVDFGDDPYPWASGSGWFQSTTLSPIWAVVGYGAVAGFQNGQTYGVHARNTKTQSVAAAHAVVVEAKGERLHEAFKRASDGRWLMRTYSPVTQGKVEKTAEAGPDWLLHDAHRSQYLEIERAPNRTVVLALLAAAGEFAPAPTPT